MADARVANPLVEQFRRGGVPHDLRLIAAQGLLPLKPEDLLELWTDLLADHEADVRAAAQASLAGYPSAELAPVLRSRETPPAVLSWAVAQRPERELREIALQNTSLPDEVVEALAPTLSEALAELVVINQTRLLRRTSLLVALEANPSLSSDQRRRLRELRETFRVGEAPAASAPAPAPPAPAAPEPQAAPVAAAPPDAPAADLAPVELFRDLTEDEAVARLLTPEERQQGEKVSAVQKIYRMDAKDKMITALKGTREERAILIRDPNRIVSSAVLGSPKLTDAEIEAFSAMKNISDQVLREIGNHKEWTKRYAVLSNLVRNPRTPIGIALTFVPRRHARDVKGLAIDRNVSEAVRKHAQKFVKGPQR